MNGHRNQTEEPNIKLFLLHLGAYVIVSVILFFTNIFGDISSYFYLALTLIWGILVVIHGRKVLGASKQD